MKKITALLLVAIVFISCEKQTQTVRIDHLYSMEIPAYMEKADDLNDEASMQYQNLLRDVYVMAMYEPKQNLEDAIFDNGLEDTYSNDLDGYAKLLAAGIEADIKPDSVPFIKKININGLDARLMEMSGKTEGIHAYWIFAFVEGSDNYYQLNTWTSADKKDNLREDMMDMMKSFTETAKSKK